MGVAMMSVEELHQKVEATVRAMKAGALIAVLVAALMATCWAEHHAESQGAAAALDEQRGKESLQLALRHRYLKDSLGRLARASKTADGRASVARRGTRFRGDTVYLPGAPLLSVLLPHQVVQIIATQDTALEATQRELTVALALDSVSEQRGQILEQQLVARRDPRLSVVAAALYEPLTGISTARATASLRVFRTVHLAAEAAQRFAPGEAPRLLIGAEVRF